MVQSSYSVIAISIIYRIVGKFGGGKFGRGKIGELTLFEPLTKESLAN